MVDTATLKKNRTMPQEEEEEEEEEVWKTKCMARKVIENERPETCMDGGKWEEGT